MILSRLAINYYRPDFTEGQAKVLIKDMIEDLDKFTVAEVEVAARKYRQDAENRFFPRSGQIIKLIEADRKERRESERAKTKGPAIAAGPDLRPYPERKSRPLMWWHKPRARWADHWRESEAPDGELVQDAETKKLRPAYRFS